MHGAAALLASAALAGAAGPAATSPPRLLGLHVTDGSAPFFGDGPLLATVSPNGDGLRDAAHVLFTLSRPATVELDVVQTDGGSGESAVTTTVARVRRSLPAGPGQLVWRPAAATPPRTYVLELTVIGRDGGRRFYGATTPGVRPDAPVVRVQGIDAGFAQASYAPGEAAELEIATDARTLTFQVFSYSGGAFPSVRDLRTDAQAMTAAARVDWSAHRNAPASILVRPGDWPSGLYFLRITANDGRVGYAPLVVRPQQLGTNRIAVVLATRTWQAYNFEDANGDGWGDSWYVDPRQRSIDTTRPYLDFGIPFRFHDWDLTFLTWLHDTGKQVDFLTDQDIDAVGSGDELRKAYDLIVFPGHEEYVTQHELDVITRFRDLGGNLAFLAANNMFWHVRMNGPLMTKVGMWRNENRPEASLVGAQYVGSNHGAVEAPFVVTAAQQAPWLFDGTGLIDGSTFGRYGIEIDATGPASPPGTIVLARIPNLMGQGRSAEMTYYETPAGAKVFDAGAIDFAASALEPPVSRLLQNLWTHLGGS